MESPPSNNDSSSATLSSSPVAPPSGQGKPCMNADSDSGSTDPSQGEQKRTSSVTHTKSPMPDQSLAGIISENFPAFDADTLIVRPFEDEAARDVKFEEELSHMLLNVILKTHAWAASRPKHEAGLESRKLEEEISQIMETEREQEQTRLRLGEFVQRMKTALAALMGAP